MIGMLQYERLEDFAENGKPKLPRLISRDLNDTASNQDQIISAPK